MTRRIETAYIPTRRIETGYEMVSFGAAARIAGLKESTLRNVRSRAPKLFESDYFAFNAAPGPGQAGGTDRLGVIFLGIFARLTAFGIAPQAAAEAGLLFVAAGDMAAHWTGDTKIPKEVRGPGELYPSGLTLLLVAPVKAEEGATGILLDGGKLEARLLNVPEDARFADVQPYGEDAQISINLNAVLAIVDARLHALGRPDTAAPASR